MLNFCERNAPSGNRTIAAVFIPSTKESGKSNSSQTGDLFGKENMNSPSLQLRAYKRAPSLEFSKWYMGNLTTNLAEWKDTNGAFLLVEVTLIPGNEPPPHVHSREDELFYVLEGEFDVYVGEEAFNVTTGECIFLPSMKPHAFLIRSPRIRLLTLFSPGGLEEAFRSMSSPAQNLELPTGALTYSMADLKETAERFSEYGIRFLTPDEIANQLPLYPETSRPNPTKHKALEVDGSTALAGHE